MKLIELLEDIEHEGLVIGDVLRVDTLSAASLVDRGVAKLVDEAETAIAETVETIDDIVDPEVAKLRASQMATTVVGGNDPGPIVVTRAPADDPADAPVVPDAPATKTDTTTKPDDKSKTSGPEVAAPGLNPAGGVAGGAASS